MASSDKKTNPDTIQPFKICPQRVGEWKYGLTTVSAMLIIFMKSSNVLPCVDCDLLAKVLFQMDDGNP